MATQYYKVSDAAANKTLQGLGLGWDVAEVLGIDERKDFLNSGQVFTVDPNVLKQKYGWWDGNIAKIEGEAQKRLQTALQKGYLTSTISPQEQAIKDALEKGKTESIGTIEKGREPLKQRYNDIISSIKGTAGMRREESDIATAREYGKRGIPLSSGVYDTAIQRGRLPVDTAEASSLANVGLQEEQANQARDFAIANIQQATTSQEVQSALQLFQIAENARQQGLSMDESARQFNEKLAYEKSLGGQTQEANPYVTLGEGSTLFNLLTGQPMYTAPKTYKADTSSSYGGW